MNKKILLIFMLILLVGAGVWAFGNFNGGTSVPYTTFVSDLDAGNIGSVEIYKDHLTYKNKGADTLYRTDNPDRDGFKEELLLKNITLADHTKEEDGLTYYLDLVFDVVFIGLIGFGVYKLISLYRSTFRVVHHTGMKFDRIAGMDNIKRDMMIVVDFLKDPKKALAEECSVNFIATKGADFQSALMSMGAMKIRLLFSKARRNRPCIVFIDEFDSIGERRNYAGTGIDKENNRIITTMLNEMDGFSPSSGILVIGATNSYQSLDPALIRAGRFDLKYHIGNPDPETRKELIRMYTAGRTISDELGEGRLSDMFKDLSCAEIETILNESASIALSDGGRAITAADITEAARKIDVKLNTKKA